MVTNTQTLVLPAQQEAIAMEGIADTLKDAWGALVKKFNPTDHEAIMARMEKLSKVRVDLIKLKQQISMGKDDGQVTANITRFTAHLPVTADTGEQLVKELANQRKRVHAMIVAAEHANTPEAIKKVREQMLLELSKKGNVSKDIIFTKKVILQVLDETIALLDVVKDAGGAYVKAHEKAKASGSVATESYFAGLALESYEDTLEIALEGLVSAIVGLTALLASITARVMMYFAWVMAIGALLTGQFAAAFGLFIAAEVLEWISRAGLNYSNVQLNGGEEEH